MRFERRTYTIGEMYKPAIEIQTEQEANEYLADLVEYSMTMFGTDFETAIKNEKSSLGYFSGYYDNETMQRVQKLFDCQHPIFGSVIPSPEEAFEMGKKLAVKS